MKKIINRFRFEWIYLRRIRLTPKGLYVLSLVVRDSLKWCFSINIGNYLQFQGKKVYVNNGVLVDYWDCLEVDDNYKIIRPDGNLAVSVRVPKQDAKKIYRFTTPFSDFMQGFRFYMGYWYWIWVVGNSDFSKYSNRPKEPKKLGQLYMCIEENINFGDKYVYGHIFASEETMYEVNFIPVTINEKGEVFERIEE